MSQCVSSPELRGHNGLESRDDSSTLAAGLVCVGVVLLVQAIRQK
jgi:hypothetical protein